MEIMEKDYLYFYQQASSLIVTGQTCVCLINPTLAMSETMSAFVL